MKKVVLEKKIIEVIFAVLAVPFHCSLSWYTNKAKKDDIHYRTTKFNFLSVKIILQIGLNISLLLQSPLEYFCRN